MLTLLTLPPAFGAPSASGFSIKAMILMNMAGLPWRRKNLNDPRRMPRGKLPVLELADGTRIPDSEDIRAWLERQGLDSFPGCDARGRAMGQALIRMGDEHLYFAGLCDRWLNDDVWPSVRDEILAEAPKPLRPLIGGALRRNVTKGMHQQGLGRLDADERAERVEPDLKAIATLLADTPFLLGEELTAADASVGSMLYGIMVSPVETRLSARVADDPALSDYAGRVVARATVPGTDAPG